jgi:heptosyltransferase-2
VCAPSAAFGAAKLWPPERFAAALDALHERHGLRAVITGGPGEEGALRAVHAACRHPALSLADEKRDLALLKALVAGSRLVLVGDSGPRWVAAAFGVPCVSVLGPNFPELTASALERCEVVRLEDLECSPCLERVCPLGHHRCLAELPAARVVEAAERLLARADAA